MLAKMMNLGCSTMHYSGIAAFSRMINRDKPRILMYHSVDNSSGILPRSLNVTPATFERQISFLVKHYNVVPLSAIVGKKNLPRRSIALTFDDGLKNNLTYAAPILKKHGCVATFYVVGQCVVQKPLWLHRWYSLVRNEGESKVIGALARKIGKPVTTTRQGVQILKYRCSRKQREDIISELEKEMDVKFDPSSISYLTSSDIKKLVDEGHTIGYHTNSHTPIAGLTDDELVEELTSSRKTLERHIGQLRHFAFPFGESRSLGGFDILDSQYESSVTTVEGFVGGDRSRLSRLSVVDGPLSVFAATVEGGRAFAANMFQKISGVYQ